MKISGLNWPPFSDTPLHLTELDAYIELQEMYRGLHVLHNKDVYLHDEGGRVYAHLWAPWDGVHTLVFERGRWRWADGVIRSYPPQSLFHALGQHELAPQWAVIDALL